MVRGHPAALRQPASGRVHSRAHCCQRSRSPETPACVHLLPSAPCTPSCSCPLPSLCRHHLWALVYRLCRRCGPLLPVVARLRTSHGDVCHICPTEETNLLTRRWLTCRTLGAPQVHVKNRCAWLNHSSNPAAFIRLVERFPNIRLWFSGVRML